jgi:hypothetical protein
LFIIPSSGKKFPFQNVPQHKINAQNELLKALMRKREKVKAGKPAINLNRRASKLGE